MEINDFNQDDLNDAKELSTTYLKIRGFVESVTTEVEKLKEEIELIKDRIEYTYNLTLRSVEELNRINDTQTWGYPDPIHNKSGGNFTQKDLEIASSILAERMTRLEEGNLRNEELNKWREIIFILRNAIGFPYGSIEDVPLIYYKYHIDSMINLLQKDRFKDIKHLPERKRFEAWKFLVKQDYVVILAEDFLNPQIKLFKLGLPFIKFLRLS